MADLLSVIKELRSKISDYKKRKLNETSTRTIVIDPVLEALGWNVRDPEVVHLEYPTIDGKPVDYALKIDGKTVLLVEAKPISDPLKDIKAITQVVGYAASDGIEWCILTNGVVWKIYRSSEKCPAPDKLLFEISYDPINIKDEKLSKIITNFLKFSRVEMANGTLDREGERVFNDSKVDKVLDKIMQNPPRALINLIKKEMQGTHLIENNKIRESIYRIWTSKEPPKEMLDNKPLQKKKKVDIFNESYHLSGKTADIVGIYREIDEFCLSLKPDGIEKKIKKEIESLTVLLQ